MVGYERPCGSASGYGLQYWGFNLDVAGGVEILAHGVVHLGAFEEYLLYGVVDDEANTRYRLTAMR